MEIHFEDRLIKKDIKKIKKEYTDNIFSFKLNNNIIKIIMNYLDKEDLWEFAKTCIFIFNNYIDYENSLLYNKLKEKAKKRICKLLLNNDKQGLGFFVEITLSFKVLIININLIKESILGNTNKILIKIDNNEKEIDLNNRIIYIDEKLNISIIEILDKSDDIRDFFEYGYYIPLKNTNEYICIFDNQNNIKENIIYGILKNENSKTNLIYTCQNNNIPFGCPIINILNEKIIGIHEKYDNLNNVGYLLNDPIDSFIKQKTFNNKPNNTCFSRRVLKELYDHYKSENNNNYHIYPRNGDLSIWDVIIFGPEDSPYKNGIFNLEIRIPKNYPFNYKGPEYYFKTKIYHPNIRGDGRKLTCCNIQELDFWDPGYRITLIVDKIYSLLKEPIPFPEGNCPHHNQECSILMTKNYEKYKEIATKWTKKYAV